MAKKKNVPAAAARSAGSSQVIENLRTLNTDLMKEVTERRKQIQQLRLELASLAGDREIADSIESQVFGLVLSSSLDEAAARGTAEMAAATEKAESTAAELNDAEMGLLALITEKDAVHRDLDELTLRSLEEAKGEKTWKKWIYPVAATAFFLASTAIVILCCKGSKPKNC